MASLVSFTFAKPNQIYIVLSVVRRMVGQGCWHAWKRFRCEWFIYYCGAKAGLLCFRRDMTTVLTITIPAAFCAISSNRNRGFIACRPLLLLSSLHLVIPSSPPLSSLLSPLSSLLSPLSSLLPPPSTFPPPPPPPPQSKPMRQPPHLFSSSAP